MEVINRLTMEIQNTVPSERGISIIICCYNSAGRLPATIKHIANQQISKNINWEVIIINNASADATATIAEELCKEFLSGVTYKVIDEPTPGLAYARKRGILESSFQFLLFCDDDNWLYPNYVQLAFNIVSDNPLIGILGSQSIGQYETSPPQWFVDNKSTFAIGEQGAKSGDVTDDRGYVWGAGFVVNKKAYDALQSFGFSFTLDGRTENKLTTGEDRELCTIIKYLGYSIYYSSDLKLHHYMPTTRFSYKSFLKLAYQNGKASVVFDLYDSNEIKYIKYFAIQLPIVARQLVKHTLLRFYFYVAKKNSELKILTDRRYYFTLGRLETLFQFSYCEEILKNISIVKLKIKNLNKTTEEQLTH